MFEHDASWQTITKGAAEVNVAQILHGTAEETFEDDKADDNEVSFRLPRTWVSLILQRYFVQHKATVNWGQPYIPEEGVKATNHI